MTSNKITKFKLANNQTYQVNDGAAIHFDMAQELSDAQKQQARANIGAATATEVETATSKTYTATLTPANWIVNDNQFIANYSNTELRASISPIVSCIENTAEYAYIIDANATAGVGIVFTAQKKPSANIILSIVDIG